MKKTLAILIALLLSASIALTSCNDESENTNDPSNNDFNVDYGTGATETYTDENGSEIVVETNESGETSSNPGASSNMETVNDTVYVLHTASIREQAKISNHNKIGEAPFGATLARSSMSSKWSYVKYTDPNGKTVEGYIANDLITDNPKTINFIPQSTTSTNESGETSEAPVVSKLAGTGNYKLRYYPLADGYPNNFSVLEADDLDLKGQIKGGTEVIVLEVSEDKMWAKISSTAVDVPKADGTFPKTYDQSAEGYIPYEFLEIADSSNQGENGGPVAG